ncbi:phosphopantetheine-binding protein [Shimia thalassica]|jgi:acyl carrier protein
MQMANREKILQLLSQYAEVPSIKMDDMLFGSGLNLSSISFTEFVVDFEDLFDIDVNMERLGADVKSVGQFVEVLEDHLS